VSDAFWNDSTPEERDLLRQRRTIVKARRQTRKKYPNSERAGQPQAVKESDAPRVHAQQAASSMPCSDASENDNDDSAVQKLGGMEATMRSVFGGMG
jgi:hypothetical protein